MPASSSASSASSQSTSSERSELTAALIPASGVRRSCETAASRAVRIRLPSASRRAAAASPARRRRSSSTAAWAAKAPSRRRSPAGSTRPARTSARLSPTGTSTSASSGRAGGRGPLAAVQRHGEWLSARSSRAAESCWKVSRTWSSRAVSTPSPVGAPRSTVPASALRVCASAWLRAAWWVRRAARSTTEATAMPTAVKMPTASTFCGSEMVKVCSGGVK